MLKTSPSYAQFRLRKAVEVADWLAREYGVKRDDIKTPEDPSTAERRRATTRKKKTAG